MRIGGHNADMSLRDNLGDSYRKEKTESTKGRYSGSKAYNRFFEGYEERLIPGENGKRDRIERIYKGAYYYQSLSDKKWVFLKMLFPVLYFASVGAFIAAALPASPLNTAWYVTILQAVCVLLYFWLFCILCSHVVSDRNMTISKYKRACKPFLKVAKGLLYVLVFTMAFSIINGILIHESLQNTMLVALYYLAAEVFVFIMYWIEKHTVYAIRESKD